VKLPDVKPAMIDHARKIFCLFTGCLSSQMNGFPPFIGLEKDYLRAQIARITATTHISPAGFYILTETAEEEAEEEIDPSVILNPEFNNDPTNLITAEQLANTDLQEWVHSQAEILPQGRTRFWRPPSTRTTHLDREEEAEEILDNSDENTIQIPAPLLQPIGDDNLLHTDQIPWSIGLTMSIMHEYSLCYVRSNVWPGAFTLGHATYVLSDLNHLLIR
jgi:radial spoke head protein 4A